VARTGRTVWGLGAADPRSDLPLQSAFARAGGATPTLEALGSALTEITEQFSLPLSEVSVGVAPKGFTAEGPGVSFFRAGVRYAATAVGPGCMGVTVFKVASRRRGKRAV